MLITDYFKKFLHNSQSSGVLLIICVAVSLMIANSSLGPAFQNLHTVGLIDEHAEHRHHTGRYKERRHPEILVLARDRQSVTHSGPRSVGGPHSLMRASPATQ